MGGHSRILRFSKVSSPRMGCARKWEDDVRGCVHIQRMPLSPRTSRSSIYCTVGLRGTLLCLGVGAILTAHALAGPLEQLSDLTDKAARAVVTLQVRDNFNSEYLYDVSVKNVSSDSLVGESLIIVLDKITNIGGNEWMTGTSESNLTRMEILGQDGETDDGKPYFRIPRGSGPDLPPYTESRPASVGIRNKDYLIVFTPVFRVYGMKRPPVSPKPEEWGGPSPSALTPTDKLIQLLFQKGMLSEEEVRTLYPQ